MIEAFVLNRAWDAFKESKFTGIGGGDLFEAAMRVFRVAYFDFISVDIADEVDETRFKVSIRHNKKSSRGTTLNVKPRGYFLSNFIKK